MSTVSVFFAKNELRQHGDKIHEWAAQSDNVLLKTLALEVITVASEGMK